MSHWVQENKGQDFERVPCGMKHAVAARLYDLGYQAGYKGGRPYHKYVLLWELEDRYTKGEMAGQRFRVTKIYTATFGTSSMPSNLRKDLENWRGRAFTAEELSHFDLDNVLGHVCTLNLVEDVKGDKKYAKISAVLPPMKKEKMTVETPADFVPDWVQEMIDNMLPLEAAENWAPATTSTAVSAETTDEPPFETF